MSSKFPNITDKLEKQITVAISKIKHGKSTPKETNIGKLLSHLKKVDEPLYDKFMAEYKIVFEQWKKNQEK